MRAAGHIVQRCGDLSRERLIIDSERRFTDQSHDLVRIVAEEVVLVDKTAGGR